MTCRLELVCAIFCFLTLTITFSLNDMDTGRGSREQDEEEQRDRRGQNIFSECLVDLSYSSFDEI